MFMSYQTYWKNAYLQLVIDLLYYLSNYLLATAEVIFMAQVLLVGKLYPRGFNDKKSSSKYPRTASKHLFYNQHNIFSQCRLVSFSHRGKSWGHIHTFFYFYVAVFLYFLMLHGKTQFETIFATQIVCNNVFVRASRL